VQDAVEPDRAQQPLGAGGQLPENQATTAPAGPIVALDEQADARGIGDLGGAEVEVEVPRPLGDESVQGEPQVGDGVDVDPTVDGDLLAPRRQVDALP